MPRFLPKAGSTDDLLLAAAIAAAVIWFVWSRAARARREADAARDAAGMTQYDDQGRPIPPIPPID